MRWTSLSVFLACLAQLSHGAERASHTNSILRGPYLQLATPHSMYVVWRTDFKMTPVVRFGLDPDNLDRQVSEGIITRFGTTNKLASLPEGMVRLHTAPEGSYQY